MDIDGSSVNLYARTYDSVYSVAACTLNEAVWLASARFVFVIPSWFGWIASRAIPFTVEASRSGVAATQLSVAASQYKVIANEYRKATWLGNARIIPRSEFATQQRGETLLLRRAD